ncbi:MAG: class E sortase [Brachybacterium sp.]|uniref:class E sortase n=1 Tax=Brachybacterium sp. TaxID=1891286 RepID=UPI003F8E9B12
MTPSHRRRRGGGLVGVLGELLLTFGVLLLLFLVWQLWWTDVVADREQAGIIDGLEQEWGEVDAEQIAPRQEGPPPAVETPADTMVWGRMHVPAFDRPAFPLAEGVSLEEVLNVKGAGHYPETALPGEVGNFSVAGHRNTYGRVFEDIARLEPGNAIVVETGDAFYVYAVTESLIVQPQDIEVIAPAPGQPGVEPTQQMLTLTACHPMYSARERYIVHAEFAYWTDRADGIPEALATAAGGADGGASDAGASGIGASDRGAAPDGGAVPGSGAVPGGVPATTEEES